MSQMACRLVPGGVSVPQLVLYFYDEIKPSYLAVKYHANQKKKCQRILLHTSVLANTGDGNRSA
jgi:hypothetical protein